MELTWLGWAGVELATDDGATVVIDPLEDPRAVFAPLRADGDFAMPAVTAPRPGAAVAGLVTHLHRDHADAGALSAALAPGAFVHEPPVGVGDATDALALAQAEYELEQAGLPRREVAPWESVEAGPFTVTALPASDGIGDPQVAWLVEADGVRVLHLGDTMFHGAWWRIARRHGPFDVVLVPVNGARVAFPHRVPASPFPAALDPEQAAVAAEILGAKVTVPIHAEGYELDGIYHPVQGAAERFAEQAVARGVDTRLLALGETITVVPAAAVG